MKKFILIIALLSSYILLNNCYAQGLSGYNKLDSDSYLDGKITLYAKVSDYGITFALKNETSKTLYCKIENVTSNWSDGKKRTKDVMIYAIPSGKIRAETYENNDNLSKMTGRWTYDRWRVSTSTSSL